MQKKWLLTAVIIGSFAMSGVAWADGRYGVIEAFFTKASYEINGVERMKDRDSIVYEGRLYVPIRTVSELLGADVEWNAESRKVSLHFITNNAGRLRNASRFGAYNYVALEHKRIVASMTEHLKNEDIEGMRSDISAWGKLQNVSKQIGDNQMASFFEQLRAAAELLRSGMESRQYSEYLLAWNILESNAEMLTSHLSNTVRSIQSSLTQ